MVQPQKNLFYKFLLLSILITTFRIFFLYINKLELSPDEAQYYSWSLIPAFGYYSKPPMIAYVISISTKLFGNSEWAIRACAPILYGMSGVLVYLITEILSDKKSNIPFTAGVVFLTLPPVSLASAIISTDSCLILFWLSAVFFFLQAIREQKFYQYLLCGISAGLGMLSKYNMGMFLISACLYLIINRPYLKKSYVFIAVTVAFLIYLPNIYWNASHGFVTFSHTHEISGYGNKFAFKIDKFLQFILAQLMIVGPIVSFYFIRNLNKNPNQHLLPFIAPFFIVIASLSLVSKALANWASPIYPLIIISAAIFLKPKFIKYTLIFNLIVSGVFYAYPLITDKYHLNLNAKSGTYLKRDPFKNMRGHALLATEIEKLANDNQAYTILTDERKLTAELLYYTHNLKFRKYNHHIHDHYDLTIGLGTKDAGENFLYVTKLENSNHLNGLFKSNQYIGTISIMLYKDYTLKYYVFYLQGYKINA